MPKNNSYKSILIIGSGPIVIGQACEFDYAGSQAARSLREEGIEVTIINSNPATIMTDTVIADNIYLLPLESESIVEILKKHKIDAVLPTMGGQTALNLCIQCDEMGIWEEYGVEIIGVDIKAIEITENREEFRELMLKIGIPMAPQKTAKSFLEGKFMTTWFLSKNFVSFSYPFSAALFPANLFSESLLKHILIIVTSNFNKKFIIDVDISRPKDTIMFFMSAEYNDNASPMLSTIKTSFNSLIILEFFLAGNTQVDLLPICFHFGASFLFNISLPENPTI